MYDGIVLEHFSEVALVCPDLGAVEDDRLN